MSKRYNDSEDSEKYTDYDDGFFDSYRRDESRDIYSDSSYYHKEDNNIYSDSSRKKRSVKSFDNGDEQDCSKKPKKKKRIRKLIASLLCISLVLGVVFVTVAFVFLEKITNKIQYEQVDDIYSRSAVLSEDTYLYSDSAVQNILICGVDADNSEYGRSDSMILLSVDKKHKKIKMTSFMRDTFVYIPDPDGGYRSKLTNAYVWGGVGLTMRTIEYNFGIKIDNYLIVNFETFKTIVDVLGGIELELTDREIEYINCQIAWNNQTEYLHAQAGKVKLNGQQALWHARNRGGVVNGVEFYEDTDWQRTERQRNFIKALISDVKSASLKKIADISLAVAPNITTDMSKSELKKFLFGCIRYRKFRVSECSMPSDDTWTYEDNFAGNVIYVNDWDQVQSDLKTFIYE